MVSLYIIRKLGKYFYESVLTVIFDENGILGQGIVCQSKGLSIFKFKHVHKSNVIENKKSNYQNIKKSMSKLPKIIKTAENDI